MVKSQSISHFISARKSGSLPPRPWYTTLPDTALLMTVCTGVKNPVALQKNGFTNFVV